MQPSLALLHFLHLLPALCVWYHRSSQNAFRKYHWLPERQQFSIGHKGMTPCPFGFPVSPPKGMGFRNNQAVSCALILDTTAVLEARSQARLLADHRKESGVWLNALPVSTLGLHMDDGLRVAIPLCCPP